METDSIIPKSGLPSNLATQQDVGKTATLETPSGPITVESSCEGNFIKRFIRSLWDYFFGVSDNTKSNVSNKAVSISTTNEIERNLPAEDKTPDNNNSPLSDQASLDAEQEEFKKTADAAIGCVFGFVTVALNLLTVVTQPRTCRHATGFDYQTARGHWS
ncbi:hypothetical protein FNU76_19720 [Chitinimonas arctica]|uniref:Uncharacterized protein n=1 Tax=Chitinimonas arctica TaxID=2594795 RepID=A0A516SJV2_9NEIS|nr:hypothetical protein [Chitinimonas arctica]QDQ28403.1 hypothetical protein FNU76_19720 [Chitinimonas arctica]